MSNGDDISTWADLSGNGNDLTLSNTPLYLSGEAGDKGGGQIRFVRTDQQYADADNPSGVRAHADIPFTMEAWARRANGDSYNTVMSIHGQYTEIGFDQSSFLFGRNGGKTLAEEYSLELLAQLPLVEINDGKKIQDDLHLSAEFDKIANKLQDSFIKIKKKGSQ